MKAQMKAADRSGTPIALIIGAEEAASASVTIRMLRQDAEQRTVEIAALLTHVTTTGAIG